MEKESKIYRKKGIEGKVLDVDRNNLKLLLSTMNHEDDHGEMFANGAFTEGIQKMKRADGSFRIALLRQHNWDKVIGKYKEIYEEGNNLIGVAELGKTQIANDAFLDIESGILRECSTGTNWRSEVGEWKQNGDNQNSLWVITKATLWEGSLVAVGANSQTGILSTKSIEDAEIELLKLKDGLICLHKELYSGAGTDERHENLEIHAKSILQQITDFEGFLIHKKSQQTDKNKELYASMNLRAKSLITKLESKFN
jgi:HK97 family phage prohead protease